MGKLARWNHIHDQMNMSVCNHKPTHAVHLQLMIIIIISDTTICEHVYKHTPAHTHTYTQSTLYQLSQNMLMRRKSKLS